MLRKEGIAGLYRGLSASYLGTVETVLYLVLYERLKKLLHIPRPTHHLTRSPILEELRIWASTSGAAAGAKLVAVLVTYPHEVRSPLRHHGPLADILAQVVRTRLRQAPTKNGTNANVHWAGTMLQAGVAARGLAWLVRGAHTTSVALNSISGHNPRGA